MEEEGQDSDLTGERACDLNSPDATAWGAALEHQLCFSQALLKTNKFFLF